MMLLAYMMIIHFVADFLMQSREMGQKKSSEWRWLARHLLIQFSFFLFGLGVFSLFAEISAQAMLLIPILNTIVHGIIDWNIWNLYKLSAHIRIKKDLAILDKIIVRDPMIDHEGLMKEAYDEEVKNWQYWNDHWFYSTIGLDQLLHCLTIIGLFALLV